MSKTVLLVEDEKPIQDALVDKLREEDFEILRANNGEEGLELSLSSHPDVILCDVVMPKMNGMVMLKRLRQDGWGKNAKVIVLTNVNPETDGTLSLILDFKPAFYLIKTETSLENIVQKVKEVLNV